jgi:hypothetical protein
MYDFVFILSGIFLSFDFPGGNALPLQIPVDVQKLHGTSLLFWHMNHKNQVFN